MIILLERQNFLEQSQDIKVFDQRIRDKFSRLRKWSYSYQTKILKLEFNYENDLLDRYNSPEVSEEGIRKSLIVQLKPEMRAEEE